MAVYFLDPSDLNPRPRPSPPVPRGGPRFGRPVRDALVLDFLLAAIVLPVLPASLVSGLGPLIVVGVGCVAVFALMMGFRNARGARGRFLRAVRSFRTLDRPGLIVHHAPDVRPTDVAQAVVTCERNLPALEKAFGVRLRYWRVRRPRVYLFGSVAELIAVYDRPYSGYAEGEFGAIVLAADALAPEMVRHEFAHLLAAKAARVWPAVILTEGLAVWAQRTADGRPVHELAAAYARNRDDPEELLPPVWQTADGLRLYEYYALAGSFTGYLIGRFGWPAYWRFYRGPMGSARAFRRRFGRHFGLTFDAARDDWLTKLRRRELTGAPGPESFEPTAGH